LAGYNLTIHDVEVKDAGEYICEVETYSVPIRQVNRVRKILHKRDITVLNAVL
jgi:hypothetical protein